MEVICKGRDSCDYSKNCSHSKLHEIKNDSLDPTENCTLLDDMTLYKILPKSCYCDVSFARNLKLEKLNNESNM